MKILSGVLFLLFSSHASGVEVKGDGRRPLIATIAFTATIASVGALTIVEHDLGDGVVAVVGTYRECHSDEWINSDGTIKKPIVIEMIAMRGDSVDFDASPGRTLIARRFRHDGWPSDIQVAKYKRRHK